MPRSSSAWRGAEALWITVAGWAMAAEKKLGNAVVLTSDRIALPEETLHYPLPCPIKESSGKKKGYFKIPVLLKVFAKDLLLWFRSKQYPDYNKELPKDEIYFIWEQHDLFPGPGKSLSRRYRVPLVKYVHAPVVWEAEKWGVKRYWWGKLLQKLETRSLRKADIIAVVSKGVKEKLIKMGVSSSKILISPMAVDPEIFKIQPLAVDALREEENINGRFVIGWIGSFRQFHGLEDVIRAFKQFQGAVPNAVLMLVGDGPERSHIENLVKRLDLQEEVIFAGKKKFVNIPRYINLFDIAIVSAKTAEDFHYSPLKLREYMVSGKAILAPNAGEIPYTFHDDYHLKLFTVGNISSLEKGMLYLFHNEEARKQIARNSYVAVLESGTWKVEVERLLDFLQKNKNDAGIRSSY